MGQDCSAQGMCRLKLLTVMGGTWTPRRQAAGRSGPRRRQSDASLLYVFLLRFILKPVNFKMLFILERREQKRKKQVSAPSPCAPL